MEEDTGVGAKIQEKIFGMAKKRVPGHSGEDLPERKVG